MITPLKKYDSFIGGSVKQYNELHEVMHPEKPKLAITDMSQQAKVRGGVFWSDRYNTLIPAKLDFISDDQRLVFNEFLERLKITVGNLK